MPSLHIGNGVSRWDIIPFVGVGLIDNRMADCHPFAFNYGVQGRYRISDALHVTAELGNATTFKDADGIGSSRQFGVICCLFQPVCHGLSDAKSVGRKWLMLLRISNRMNVYVPTHGRLKSETRSWNAL